MPNRDANETRHVLFLCTGNYYRSRFAEIFFNWQVQERGLPWLADSRGLALDTYNYGPISAHTRANLTARGIHSETYTRMPLPVCEADFAAADRVIAVKEAEHRPLMRAKFPEWQDRIEYWHVHDLDCATSEIALPHLEREVVRLLDGLTAA